MHESVKQKENTNTEHPSNKYDFIFSLGEACFSAGFLRKHKLREFSAPFDWMYGSTFENRVKMLINRFEGWLELKDLIFSGQRENPEPCDIYTNKKTNLVFNHDFALNTKLEDTFAEVKEKYDRRINRLLDYLNNADNKILIVYMTLPNSTSNPTGNEQITELVQELNKSFNATIDLVYIEHEENYKDCEFTVKSLGNHVKKVKLFNRDREIAETFTGNIKNFTYLLNNTKIFTPMD